MENSIQTWIRSKTLERYPDTPGRGVYFCFEHLFPERLVLFNQTKRLAAWSFLIPDASVLDALKTAAASGVEIELMIPGIKAGFFLDPVTNYYSGQLLEYGTKVYKYKGYIHAKIMIIDDELCCIGSANMDMRSLMVDDEVCGVFYENDLVQKYNHIYDGDIHNGSPYTWEEFRNRDRKERIMESVFLPFAPLM